MPSFKQLIQLDENRIDFLKDTVTDIDHSHDDFALHKDPKAIIDHFANTADPTSKKLYTSWIVNRYKNKDFRQEDSPRIHTALSHFDRYKSKLEEKDINKYQSLNSLEDAVAPHVGSFASKSEEVKAVKDDGADKIYDSPTLSVHKIKTHDAACLYGANTKWCTASKGNTGIFDSYNKQGPLFVAIDKTTNKKYQLHFPTNQYMKEDDTPISTDGIQGVVKKMPELANVKEFGEHHPMFESDHSKITANILAKKDNQDGWSYINSAIPVLGKEHIKTVEENFSDENLKKYSSSLLNNKHTSPSTLSKILNDSSYNSSYVYHHPNASDEVKDEAFRIGQEKNHSLHEWDGLEPRHISALITKPGIERHEFVALLSHQNTPSDILVKHSDDESFAGAVAKHKNTPPDVLSKLAKSEHFWIRKNVASNKKAPADVIRSLRMDPHPAVQEEALKNKAGK